MNQSLYNRTEMALIVTHVTGYLWIVTVSSLYFQSTDKPFPKKCTQALITLVLIWFPFSTNASICWKFQNPSLQKFEIGLFKFCPSPSSLPLLGQKKFVQIPQPFVKAKISQHDFVHLDQMF